MTFKLNSPHIDSSQVRTSRKIVRYYSSTNWRKTFFLIPGVLWFLQSICIRMQGCYLQQGPHLLSTLISVGWKLSIQAEQVREIRVSECLVAGTVPGTCSVHNFWERLDACCTGLLIRSVYWSKTAPKTILWRVSSGGLDFSPDFYDETCRASN